MLHRSHNMISKIQIWLGVDDGIGKDFLGGRPLGFGFLLL